MTTESTIPTPPTTEPAMSQADGTREFIPVEPPTERCLITDVASGTGTVDVWPLPCDAYTFPGEVVWPPTEPEPEATGVQASVQVSTALPVTGPTEVIVGTAGIGSVALLLGVLCVKLARR